MKKARIMMAISLTVLGGSSMAQGLSLPSAATLSVAAGSNIQQLLLVDSSHENVAICSVDGSGAIHCEYPHEGAPYNASWLVAAVCPSDSSCSPSWAACTSDVGDTVASIPLHSGLNILAVKKYYIQNGPYTDGPYYQCIVS